MENGHADVNVAEEVSVCIVIIIIAIVMLHHYHLENQLDCSFLCHSEQWARDSRILAEDSES